MGGREVGGREGAIDHRSDNTDAVINLHGNVAVNSDRECKSPRSTHQVSGLAIDQCDSLGRDTEWGNIKSHRV